jgi:hypothetical protein
MECHKTKTGGELGKWKERVKDAPMNIESR